MHIVHVFMIILGVGISWGEETLLSELESEIAEMVARSRPSVVTVYARGVRRPDWTAPTIGRSPLDARAYWQENVGSGLVIDPDGHVLTMGNVVSGASDIAVRFVESEGRRTARLVGLDKRSGIAVIKLEDLFGSGASFGDSDRLRPGHWAIIMGNSFGTSSASLGLICERPDRGGLIQLTARACPGNSGAPVFDSRGQVVGILIAALTSPQAPADDATPPAVEQESGLLAADTGAASLALPINRARTIAQRLIQRSRPAPGWLGVVSRSDGSSGIQGGVPIVRVLPGSPADRAGLVPDDVILAYDRHRILDVYELMDRVEHTAAGTAVDLEIQRGEERMTLPVRIGRQDAEVTR